MTPALPRRLLLAGRGLWCRSEASVAGTSAGTADQEITDWIVIAPDGEITLGLSQPEVGQGSYTALPQILADELDADWQRVKVRFVTGRDAYKIAFKSEPPVRRKAPRCRHVLYSDCAPPARARDVLIRAAADRWNVTPHAAREGLRALARGQRLSYGALAAAAAKLPLRRAAAQGARRVRADRQAARPSRHAGQVHRPAVFGIDVVVPDMLYGAIRSAPSFTGSLTAIRNEAEILAARRARVVRLPAVHRRDGRSTLVRRRTHDTTRYASWPIASGRPSARRTRSTRVRSRRGGDLSTAKIDGLLRGAMIADKA